MTFWRTFGFSKKKEEAVSIPASKGYIEKGPDYLKACPIFYSISFISAHLPATLSACCRQAREIEDSTKSIIRVVIINT